MINTCANARTVAIDLITYYSGGALAVSFAPFVGPHARNYLQRSMIRAIAQAMGVTSYDAEALGEQIHAAEWARLHLIVAEHGAEATKKLLELLDLDDVFFLRYLVIGLAANKMRFIGWTVLTFMTQLSPYCQEPSRSLPDAT